MGDLFKGPSVPAQAPPPPVGNAPQIDATDIARIRNNLNQARNTRASLVYDPALNTPKSDGISIPIPPV